MSLSVSQKVADKLLDDYVSQGERVIKHPLDQLTSREREVLQLVVEGKTSAEIANMLFISQKTVETYRARLMEKLSLSDLPSLVKFAIQQGVISLDY